MGNYDEVKEKAARIYPLRGMAEAALKQGDKHKALEYAGTFCDRALEIRDAYPNTFAAYVVYMNASGLLSRMLSDLGEKRRAYVEFLRCLVKIQEILLPDLTNEIACQTLTAQVANCIPAYMDILDDFGENDTAMDLVFEYYTLYEHLYNQLKQINPENTFITLGGKRLLDALQRMGFSADEEKSFDAESSIDYIVGLSASLGLNI